MDLTALQRMDLSGNALSGPVSSLPPLLLDLKLNNNQFTDLSVITPFLSAADVSFNELVTLGDLTGNNLKTLKVENNNLTFEDLEPNVPIPEFTYSPQDSVESKQSMLVELGTSETLASTTAGSANVYQWFRNDLPIAGEVSSSLTLPDITVDHRAAGTEEKLNVEMLPAGNYILTIQDRGIIVGTSHVMIE